MKGVIVQAGDPKSIVLFNNGRIGAIPTPEDCHVGMVVRVNYNNKLKIAALALAALLLIGLGVFIGVSFAKGGADIALPAAGMIDTGHRPISTVEQARTLPDDSYVELTGRIERFLGDENYIFSDPTGTITVEIDDKHRRNFSVGDTVRIRGEVDVESEGMIIDVNTIHKVAEH